MCKFNNRLFIYVFIVFYNYKVLTKPIQTYYDILNNNDYDYDIHYDRRQNGTENIHIKLDGFVIVLPSDTEETNQSYSEDSFNILALSLLGDAFLGLEKKSEKNIQNAADNGNKIPYEYETDSHKQAEQIENNNAAGNEKIPEHLDENTAAQKSSDDNISKPIKTDTKKLRTKFRFLNLLKLLQRNQKE